ncbi:MAG: ATPase, T2SS/T4P/T4SS family, partial [Bacillota bacterium]|nr:ATPase, T2SS/T4P/T4SS family [Bacillota bacterium]
HTNSAVGTINRLVEMGVKRYLLTDALKAVISQRLIRKICERCKISYNPSETEKKLLKISSGEIIFRGKGCSYCNNSGYFGRTIVSEIFLVGEKTKREMLKDNFGSSDNGLTKGGNLTDQCRKLVLLGVTTTEELMKIANIQV